MTRRLNMHANIQPDEQYFIHKESTAWKLKNIKISQSLGKIIKVKSM